ncbi:MAG: hypothetical protein IIA45_14220 [Bacteroidetes bacterium]|nr:hypothetical protein [Bacteroidota bacterium]
MSRIIVLLIVGILLSASSTALTPAIGEGNLFVVDEHWLEQEFRELNALEKLVEAHPGITFLEIKAIYVNPYNFNPGFLVDDSLNQLPLGIPAFLWGFTGGFIGSCTSGIVLFIFVAAAPVPGVLLGLAGVIFVYAQTEDQSQTWKAMLGCVLGNVVGLGITAVILIALLGLLFLTF